MTSLSVLLETVSMIHMCVMGKLTAKMVVMNSFVEARKNYVGWMSSGIYNNIIVMMCNMCSINIVILKV